MKDRGSRMEAANPVRVRRDDSSIVTVFLGSSRTGQRTERMWTEADGSQGMPTQDAEDVPGGKFTDDA